MAVKQQFEEIIMEYGEVVSKKAIELLLKDTQTKELSEFIAKTWRDCFSPTMVNLGCQFVEGKAKDTEELGVSMSLMNLSFRLWDDIIDDTSYRTLRSTFVGNFGKNITLIYGGLVSTKALMIANKADLELHTKNKINGLIWNYWSIMANSEINDLNQKIDHYSAKNKLDKIKAETINIQTCLKIGAIIGNGSRSDIEVLENYGLHFGIMLELIKDLKVSFNLTLELEKKIQQNQLPLLLLLAQEESKQTRKVIDDLRKKDTITSGDISQLMEFTLRCKAWAKYQKFIEDAYGNCLISLTDKDNMAAQTLEKIARLQFKIYLEILE